MQIRQITADERPELMFPLQAYAFGPSPWPPQEVEEYRRDMAHFGEVTTLVAVEGDEVLAGVSAIPMRQNVRGAVHAMAGVASVATHPSARRRGLARELLTGLLRRMRDDGCAVSVLYPFRPSFYARFGYVGLPKVRTATFAPPAVGHLLDVDLPGTVDRVSAADGYDAWRGLSAHLLGRRHGFAVFPPARAELFRVEPAPWLAVARAGGEVVGVLPYRIEQHGGRLLGGELLTSGPVGRALLLRYLAAHVDQVAEATVKVPADELPELWGTDMAVTAESRVVYPGSAAPMARVLDLPGLAGTPAGPGAVVLEVTGDELVTGRWRLDGDGGALAVTRTDAAPVATLTVAGLSALLYGVLDPVELGLRGLGAVDDAAVAPLRSMFGRAVPYVCAEF